MNPITCKFKDIYEKDMDLLFLEEFVADQNCANIFLNQINMCDAYVVEVEHSKTDAEYGESDMTVIVERNGVRHALLIEDKIDAIAMPNQAQRYFEMGRLGVEYGEYDSFDVFIVAPHKYLHDNKEAKAYPHQISYEEIVQFFEGKSDGRSQFKLQQILQAIHKQKTGYQVKENRSVTEFWDAYIDYQKAHYPSLWLVSSKGAKGTKASWAHYRTVMKGCFIYHKIEKEGLLLVQTNKSAALRMIVPELRVQETFDGYIDQVNECFQAVEKMSGIAKRLDAENIKN